jgi:hypothetical protein
VQAAGTSARRHRNTNVTSQKRQHRLAGRKAEDEGKEAHFHQVSKVCFTLLESCIHACERACV